MQNFGVTSKEHYGMLWYFLEWSIASLCYGYESSFLYFFMFLFTVILRWFIWYLHVMIEIYTWSCKTDHFFLVQGLNWRSVSSAGRDRGFKPRPGQRPGSLKNWKHHVGCDLLKSSFSSGDRYIWRWHEAVGLVSFSSQIQRGRKRTHDTVWWPLNRGLSSHFFLHICRDFDYLPLNGGSTV